MTTLPPKSNRRKLGVPPHTLTVRSKSAADNRHSTFPSSLAKASTCIQSGIASLDSKRRSKSRGRPNRIGRRKEKKEYCCRYNSYGKSSDPSLRQELPDPYAELQSDLNKPLSGGSALCHEKTSRGAEGDVVAITGLGDEAKSRVNGREPKEEKVDEKQGEDDDAVEDDDEDDEEVGMPQAVRSLNESAGVTCTVRDLLLQRHRARMEDIAIRVEPRYVVQHLKVSGYFNYSYSTHARSKFTYHNLRRGKKRSTERLMKLLLT